MTKRKIIFRTDGNGQIGMGHYVRSLALANMLKKDFQCVFATRKPTSYQEREIIQICNTCIILSNDDHYSQFLNKLVGDEIVVLDNYYFNTDYQQAIKNKGCKLVCIDDMHDRHYVADIVINNAEGLDANAYSKEPYTKLLLGYKFSLLRLPFLEAARQTQITTPKQKLSKVLISLGATNPESIIIKITNQLLAHPAISEVHLITNIDPKSLTNKANKKTAIYWQLNAEEMVDLMKKTDFGFLPASTLSTEAIACRLPFICGWFVNNQKDNYISIEEKSLALGIGDINTVDDKALYSAITSITNPEIANSIFLTQREAIDGCAKERLINEFLQLT
ncbi:UDP-2,4-diacetamido-2,4,6-trideoxy-beta-L-altropyranose hydrolase [Geofilum rubicundum]|uniref:N-acetylneuraminate cytidylyltransferase n=1 Tax=Geofilum rubicundum JCM 15548 TaxID=1236989 RepID=A0A0E9LY25_9BACT|nr:UDP-2,4-diacetamido-2,4,6-trideoxy-beta-L-altropyranose hydrolase [Geofilum rubicundum]GAO30462.1 N-acetylneuraminate cytidylyltransferase [Geofilum rubicundum JCM 15548]